LPDLSGGDVFVFDVIPSGVEESAVAFDCHSERQRRICTRYAEIRDGSGNNVRFGT